LTALVGPPSSGSPGIGTSSLSSPFFWTTDTVFLTSSFLGSSFLTSTFLTSSFLAVVAVSVGVPVTSYKAS